MLSIRFKRIGRKKMPIYRIVVMEKHKDPWANYKEKLGFYNPRTKETELKTDRIKYWLSVGAQPSDTVHNLFVRNGLIEADKKKAVKISKKRTVKINKKKAAAEESSSAKAMDDKKTKEAKEKKDSSAEASAKVEEPKVEETPAEVKTEEIKEEPKVEEKKKEKVEEKK